MVVPHMSDTEKRLELIAFVRESNAIEGIYRKPSKAEIAQTEIFLALRAPTAIDVVGLVTVYQPDAVLRNRHGLNVRVGNHIAPPGSPEIAHRLDDIISGAVLRNVSPWDTHVAYETLHPFTDGNGRSGRALWAWQMLRLQEGLPLGFLHQFYYQTLARSHHHDLPIR